MANNKWCYNPAACGQACNAVCALYGLVPMVDKTKWSQIQDTAPECQAIADAFGIGGGTSIASYTYACAEDNAGDHTNVKFIGPLLCSNYAGCPMEHLTNMDQLGVACGPNSRRSLCPCQ